MYFVPGVAHTYGLAGTLWVSDIVLTNPGATDAVANLYFVRAGLDNSDAQGVPVLVSGNSSLYVADVLWTLFGKGDSYGGLVVGAPQALNVSCRTYNQTPNGTYGQYIPGYPLDEAIRQGEQVRLIQLTRNAAYRTNIGFANAVASILTAHVEIYRSDGAFLGAEDFGIPPYGHFQVNDIIGQVAGTDVDDAYAIVSSNSPAAAYFTYASVVDNATGDPIYVAPVREGVTAGTSVYIPAAAHVSGAAGTNWRTDLEVHNPGFTTATFRVELLKRDQANPSPVSRTFNLGPGRSVRYEDALMTLFSFSGAAALRITPASGVIMVSSRTYNRAAGGTYGQFIPAADPAVAITDETMGTLAQLARSDAYRTNVGFVNVTGESVGVVVELYDAAGMSLGIKTYTLRAYEHRQVNGILGQVTDRAIAGAYAIVSTSTPAARFLAYASVVDNRSGDPVYVPAQVTGAGSSPPSGESREYHEDFSANPRFTSLAPSYAYWDSSQGNYYVKTRDDLAHKYWAYSPQFGPFDPNAGDVTVQFDMMIENQNWGTYPGVRFFSQEPTGIEVPCVFAVRNVNADNMRELIQISACGAAAYQTPQWSVRDNVWYTVRLVLKSPGSVADILVKQRSNGQIIGQWTDVYFPTSSFSWLGVGYYDEPNYGSDWAPIRIDNVSISQ